MPFAPAAGGSNCSSQSHREPKTRWRATSYGWKSKRLCRASAPKLREAFVLIEALGLTYREAGRAIGVPEGTVKSRVFHAREQLVSWMSAGEEIADDA
jgi:hypothetical protein